MSKSKYEYVKNYETKDACLPSTYILLRIDGRGFHKFSEKNDFAKPNDKNALILMNMAAQKVCEKFKDIFIAYGQSDEFTFVFDRKTDIFNRRKEKIATTVVSLFTAVYNMNFKEIMDKDIKGLATFDGRIVVYPTLKSLKDYMRWRQVDCHINNLYNTCFWKLVNEGGQTPHQAEQTLNGTVSADKNELLFSKFNTNYTNEDAMYRKGSTFIRQLSADPEKVSKYNEFVKEGKIDKLSYPKKTLKWTLIFKDIIKDQFWTATFPNLD